MSGSRGSGRKTASSPSRATPARRTSRAARAGDTEDAGDNSNPLDVARRSSLALIGHEAGVSAFRGAFAAGRLHHAWLLTGADGIGKAALAFRMARILLNAEDPASAAGRRVTAGSHADLLAIGRSFDEKRQRQRGEIVADEIRPINAFLRRTAAEGGWRVVIVDNADAMNRNAANALLKILEEPPDDALLLLTCATPGRLLPTIRSRCRKLELSPLDAGQVRTVLERVVPDAGASEIDRVVPLAQGSPGRAVALLADTNGAIAAIAREAVAGMETMRVLQVAEGIARSETGFPLLFTLLGDTLAATLRSGAGRGNPAWSAALAERWETIGRIRSETERFNLDKQQAVIAALTTASLGR